MFMGSLGGDRSTAGHLCEARHALFAHGSACRVGELAVERRPGLRYPRPGDVRRAEVSEAVLERGEESVALLDRFLGDARWGTASAAATGNEEQREDEDGATVPRFAGEDGTTHWVTCERISHRFRRDR
jgi:hypothetical protein